MQTTLIYNPQAGTGAQPGPEEILEALRQVGLDPVYNPTPTLADLDQALSDVKDLVVVAGGDGSIRAVSTRLLEKDIKITPLPMGTANNIARLLAVNGSAQEIIAGLANPGERDMDIGCLQSEDGPAFFLEALGIGAFADGLKKYQPENGKSIARSIQSTLETLKGYQPNFFHINLDGEDFSGSYFMLEVMNAPTLSYRFVLAPEAKADDGLFDLVLIHANQRDNYLKFMTGVLMGNLESFPGVSVQRGRYLEIAWRGFPLHLDGEVFEGIDWSEEEPESAEKDEATSLDVAGPHLQVELLPQAIHFLLPQGNRKQGSE